MGEGMPKAKTVSVVEEALGNVPTKESLEWSVAESKKSLETYKNRLQVAQDTPVSNLFSEGMKHRAISDHQVMVDHMNAQIEDGERKLAELGSK